MLLGTYNIYKKYKYKEPTISTRSTSKEPMLLGTYNIYKKYK